MLQSEALNRLYDDVQWRAWHCPCSPQQETSSLPSLIYTLPSWTPLSSYMSPLPLPNLPTQIQAQVFSCPCLQAQTPNTFRTALLHACYCSCCSWPDTMLLWLQLQPHRPLELYYILPCLLTYTYITFFKYQPLNSIPVQCDPLTSRLDAAPVCYSCHTFWAQL